MTTPTPERDLAEHLAIRLPRTEELAASLDEDTLGDDWWWASTLPALNAAVIGDHVGSCLRSIRTNLVEAALDLEAFQKLDREHAEAFACPAYDGAGELVAFKFPPPTIDGERRDRHIAMHVGGVFRAVTGALDCLAAVIIFVGGMPRSLVKADFPNLRTALEKRAKLKPAQVEIADVIADAIAQVGPAGWLEYVDSMRNVLLHRGRKLTLGWLTPKQRAEGVMWWATHHLPRDPAMVEFLALTTDARQIALKEPAERTMGAAIAAVRDLSERVAVKLREVWLRRRADHSLVTTPVEQFDPATATAKPFAGFTAQGPLEMPEARVSPQTYTRLKIVQRLQAAEKPKGDDGEAAEGGS